MNAGEMGAGVPTLPASPEGTGAIAGSVLLAGCPADPTDEGPSSASAGGGDSGRSEYNADGADSAGMDGVLRESATRTSAPGQHVDAVFGLESAQSDGGDPTAAQHDDQLFDRERVADIVRGDL